MSNLGSYQSILNQDILNISVGDLSITGLTANRPLYLDANNLLASVSIGSGLSFTAPTLSIDTAQIRALISGTSPITYNSTTGAIGLNTSAISHSTLSGLNSDDHTQYYNYARLLTVMGSGALSPVLFDSATINTLTCVNTSLFGYNFGVSGGLQMIKTDIGFPYPTIAGISQANATCEIDLNPSHDVFISGASRLTTIRSDTKLNKLTADRMLYLDSNKLIQNLTVSSPLTYSAGTLSVVQNPSFNFDITANLGRCIAGGTQGTTDGVIVGFKTGVGVYTNPYIQAYASSNYTTPQTLLINPNGGQITVGTASTAVVIPSVSPQSLVMTNASNQLVPVSLTGGLSLAGSTLSANLTNSTINAAFNTLAVSGVSTLEGITATIGYKLNVRDGVYMGSSSVGAPYTRPFIQGVTSNFATHDLFLNPAGGNVHANYININGANQYLSSRLAVAGSIWLPQYSFYGLTGGNSNGFLYGCFNKYYDGIHIGYNFYNDNTLGSGNIIPNSFGATSRITMGYGVVQIFTGGINTEPTIQGYSQDSLGNVELGSAFTTVSINGSLKDRNGYLIFGSANHGQMYGTTKAPVINNAYAKLTVMDTTLHSQNMTVDLANTRLEAISAGTYNVNFYGSVYQNSGATRNIVFRTYRSGTAYGVAHSITLPSSTDYYPFHLTDTMDLAAGQYVEIWASSSANTITYNFYSLSLKAIRVGTY